jgi:signal transduction histidine kinase
LRLVVNVAAMALIGLLVVDVAFVFWSQSQLGQRRRLELENAALHAVQRIAGVEGDPSARLEVAAAESSVELTLVGGSAVVTTADPPIPVPRHDGRRRVVEKGFEHVILPLPAGWRWTHIVASRRLRETVARVMEMQKGTLLFLFAVLVVMVALGVIFLRRAVVAPLNRMTELVGRRDQEALTRFGLEARDDLGRLSNAIIGMTQRIDDDRKRIAWQLEELRAAHKELSSAQQQLVRAERLAVVGQLAAGLAHEIGNPLAVLIGYLDVLEDAGLEPDERVDSLRRMRRELDRIALTVRDLLDFSRAPSAGGEVGDLKEALVHARKLLQPQDRLRGIDLEIGDLDEAIWVPLEAGALTQVLLNLTLNAADALNGSGRIRVLVRQEGDGVVLTVEDSGPGIPADAAQHIFEPFYTTKPAGSGTGLGLAVCDHIVSSAGGEIRVVESALGGAAFRITLPVSGSPT